ncbi:Protein MOS2 [Acorus calamus]|uniref:Protein MOS2 n=1 Tax=Acorus calamus TaxID=4465 RepID=A0AAV9CHA0_ACOCL|nr:Protein MOS2 [Acorus calamus]
MKLSFSIPSNKKKKQPFSGLQNPNRRSSDASDQPKPQFVTEFTTSSDTTAPSDALIIPPKPNESLLLRHKKLRTSLPDPSEDPSIHFESESIPTDDPNNPPPGVTYGLNPRRGSVRSDEPKEKPIVDQTLLRFKIDMETLPDHRGEEEFAAVSMEDFAEGVLRGYGWKKGQGVARLKGKEDVKVAEIERRSAGEGLGFRPGGDKKPPMPPPKERIVGSKASIRWRRELEISKKRRGREESSGGDRPVRWVRSRIRVRVISKKYKGGAFYRKKGEVLDVVGPTTCDIAMDGGKVVLDGVEQELLETAIPKEGGNVLVLLGRHKGAFGRLVKMNTERETAVVRDADSHELLKVRLEEIAEYVGDPSELGY